MSSQTINYDNVDANDAFENFKSMMVTPEIMTFNSVSENVLFGPLVEPLFGFEKGDFVFVYPDLTKNVLIICHATKQQSASFVWDVLYGPTLRTSSGAQTGYIYSYPCCSCVTATGRRSIDLVVKKVKWMYKDCDENSPTYCELVYGDTDSALITFPNGIESPFCDENPL